MLLKTQNWIYLIPKSGPIIFGTKRFRDHSAPPEPNHVTFKSATATSFLTETLPGNELRYEPERLLNWDITQGWVEGAPGDGSGEKLTLTVRGGEKSSSLIFYNGFIDPDNIDLFYLNARVKDISIKVDSGESYEYQLADKPDCQIIFLPELSNTFEVTILSSYPGKKYNDLSIAGIFANLLYYDFSHK